MTPEEHKAELFDDIVRALNQPRPWDTGVLGEIIAIIDSGGFVINKWPEESEDEHITNPS
jgi:hypothetical protein